MPSRRPDRVRAAARRLAAGAAALTAAWTLAVAPAVAAPAPLTRAQVDAVAKGLSDIPTLTGMQPVRELRFKPDNPEPDRQVPRTETPGWLQWLAEFMAWFADAGRWVMWLLLALGLAWLLVRLHRWFGGRDAAAADGETVLPTQVRGLDIRPDSLPDDVGAAAWALWQRGDARACLGLLYRGALSQLVHGHGVPIRNSSTEGDCLRLAAPRLPQAPLDYLRGLVAVWAEAVYAARTPTVEQVRPLCEGFASLRPAVTRGAPP